MKQKLAELGRRLAAGSVNQAEYDRELDLILGTTLKPRDLDKERVWERSRRTKSEPES